MKQAQIESSEIESNNWSDHLCSRQIGSQCNAGQFSVFRTVEVNQVVAPFGILRTCAYSLIIDVGYSNSLVYSSPSKIVITSSNSRENSHV